MSRDVTDQSPSTPSGNGAETPLRSISGNEDQGGEKNTSNTSTQNHKQLQANTSTPPQPGSETSSPTSKSIHPLSKWQRATAIIFYTPKRCRWDPETPPKFSMGLNLLFAFAGAFTVANLYYNHPILNILAKDFGVPYDKVAQIPTLAQAGYAIGLWFLCPLGDLLKRRPFVLSLVLFTATMSIGLCVTPSFTAFSTIQFIIGLTTVTPQLMLPLVGDLAPPNKRAAALSIVVAGFMLGILVARLLSGIVTNYTSWRNVYWMSVGLQYAIFASLWLFMPDYPATNEHLNYFKMLWSILTILFKHPVLVQACLISFFTAATFTSFWTDLTFLLSAPPYNYSPVIIGLFALIAIVSICISPFYARLIIDRFVPLFSVILGLIYCMLGICIGAYTGSFSVVGPIMQAWFLDFGMQSAQIANRSSIYAIEPKARNRVNTAFMVATFFGQLTGTSVGAHLYARAGWVGSQSYSVASIGVALLLCFARGPWEERWVGWRGGWSIKKKSKTSADGKVEEEVNHLQVRGGGGVGGDVEKGNNGTVEEVRDLEKGEVRHDEQDAVNATDAEKALEMRAAESEDELADEEMNSLKSDEILPSR